jgi:APA family basic amino acid/polyamine antiporter
VRALFRRKPITDAVTEVEGGVTLRRSLGAFDLTLLGVGAIVGAGIFSSVGQMAAGGAHYPGAGPGLMLSFLLTAAACGFAAMCYAEIAAMCPLAGSAYTYAYVALGEVVAWVIGWDLIIEYAIGNIYVAQSWGDYCRSFLRGALHVDFPAWMASDVQTAARTPEIAAAAPHLGKVVIAFNLPAALIVGLITVLLVIGIKESARFNAVIVGIKILLVSGFVGVGAFFVQPAHWHPFAPNGLRGIWSGASLAFFSYIGFDAISTAAEETRNPQRDLPRGMIWSLVICTVMYVATAAVLTGLAPWQQLGTGDPLALALRLVGLEKLATVMSFGALIAVTAVLLVFQMGQPRIFMAMSRDGLLPPVFGRIHPRFRTPAVGTVLTGLFVAVSASFLTGDQALELTNIGTLFAFVLVSVGVIALRSHSPQIERPFRCPGYPVTPILSIAACLLLMAGLEWTNWVRFAVWLLVGGVIYHFYGRKHSRLSRRN